MAEFKMGLVVDGSSAIRGTKDVGGALERLGDSLEGVEKDSTQLERTFTDAARDMVAAGKDAARDTKRALTDAFDDSGKAAKKMGDTAGEGFDAASEGAANLKDEAKANATEVAASFDGSVDSIAGGFQGLASTAFAGFGPAGAIAGLAIAAGIGVWFTQFQEDQAAAEERISGMADAMIEANRKVLAEDFINDQLRDIFTNADGAAISLEDLQAAAEATGVSQTELARAFAGDQDARVRALQKVRAEYAAANADEQSLDNAVAASGSMRKGELDDWLTKLETLGENYDTASGRAQGYSDAVKAGHQDDTNAVGETLKAYQDLHREIANRPAPPPIVVPVAPDFTDFDRQVARKTATITASIKTGTAVV